MVFLRFPSLACVLSLLVVVLPGVWSQSSSPCSITSITGNVYDFSGVNQRVPGVNPKNEMFSYSVCGSNPDCSGSFATSCTNVGGNPIVPLNSAGDVVSFSFVNPLFPQLGVLATYPIRTAFNVQRSLTVLLACGPDFAGFAAFVPGNLDSPTGTGVATYAFVVPTSVICNLPTSYPGDS